MTVPVDPGTSLLDGVDYVLLAGATGIHARFSPLYSILAGGLTSDNLSMSTDFLWGGNHRMQSGKLKILSSGAAFSLIFAVATVFTADRTLTIDMGDASRSVTLGGNLTTTAAVSITGAFTTSGAVSLTGAVTTAAAFTTSGAFALTLTQTGITNVTLPVTGTLATLAGVESFSNKTIAAPVFSGTATGTYTLAGTPTITAPTITAPKVTTGSLNDQGDQAASVTFDLSLGNVHRVRLTGATVTIAFSNPGNRERFLIEIAQDTTGSRAVTWPTKIRWLNGTGATDSTTDKPTLTTTASKVDVFSFIYNQTLDLYYGSVVGFKGAIT